MAARTLGIGTATVAVAQDNRPNTSQNPKVYEKVGTQPTGFGAQTGFFSPALGTTLRCHTAPEGWSGRGNPRLRHEVGARNGVAAMTAGLEAQQPGLF